MTSFKKMKHILKVIIVLFNSHSFFFYTKKINKKGRIEKKRVKKRRQNERLSIDLEYVQSIGVTIKYI